MDAIDKVLTAAADLLEKPGAWTQGANARDRNGHQAVFYSPAAKCWCARGAILRIDGDGGLGAEERLSAHVLTTVPAFNDAPGRTQAEVVAALRAARKVST